LPDVSIERSAFTREGEE